jgi:predicted RNA-binding Zn ribbon-like protein
MDPDDDGVPAAARLLRDFVNTREPQVDAESLTDATALRSWLLTHGLVTEDVRLTEADRETAVAVREGLRAVLLRHAGHESEPGRLEALNGALARVPVTVSFDGDGYRMSGAGAEPGTAALGGLLDAVRRAREEGSWPRLKVCARDSCRWAYYDASRNQVRRWCSMAGCGNHVKMQRAYLNRKTRSGGG